MHVFSFGLSLHSVVTKSRKSHLRQLNYASRKQDGEACHVTFNIRVSIIRLIKHNTRIMSEQSTDDRFKTSNHTHGYNNTICNGSKSAYGDH